MAKLLMRSVESYKVDTEAEAQEVIQDAIAAGGELTKKTIELKQKKSKGQIVDECLKVTVQVDYSGLWLEEESSNED
ncbi:hypothetical protein [Massilibacteroides sp.]|uniref:hypothetical protein n=1 Tax=Massilibacteroides sp. TaxID=2034766 RepID=UPI002638C3B6|nr:hypothetical protein [Massilibacteroides sp.]MDD4516358.1 hypothetical protein [Massilibacteroides sp.]